VGGQLQLFVRLYQALEPIAAISHPPGDEKNRDGRNKAPPDWEQEIRDDPQDGKDNPEDFSFHEVIVGHSASALE
jgi:hypothetical protein